MPTVSPTSGHALGFADAVTASQSVFRALLAAMAEPGRIVTLDGLPQPPAGISPAAAAVLLALADYETPLWLMTPDAAVEAYLRFETGARIVMEPALAAFALVSRAADLATLDVFAQGEPEYPDRSTTLVMEVARLDEAGSGGGLLLSGPGIKSTTRLDAGPLPADFKAMMAVNRQRFPLGVDIVLAAGDRIACLPRSLTVA